MTAPTPPTGRPRTDLSRFDNGWYHPGRSVLVRALWFVVNAWVMQSRMVALSRLRVALLRAFGAQVGRGVVIKPSVNIKYPWRLIIGEYAWIGERVWVDNLEQVTIGAHACLSQGALILCGSHDYADVTFGLIARPISIGAGGWVGARAIVCPGVNLGDHAVLAAGSVATRDLPPYQVWQGNPATYKRDRPLGTAALDTQDLPPSSYMAPAGTPAH